MLITQQTLRDLEAVGAVVDANGEANIDEVEKRLVTVRANLAAWEPYL